MDRLRAGAPSCGHCGLDLVRQPELHVSGNFWWARADRIASLPEPNELPISGASPTRFARHGGVTTKNFG